MSVRIQAHSKTFEHRALSTEHKKIHIGTSGWSYNHWKNTFYPPGLPANQWLRYYARQFDTVEINASFYRLPTTETVQSWVENAPRGFKFAVKLWKHITHTKKLNDTREKLDIFFDVLNHLGSKHGPLLVQLPPKWNKNAARLDQFLTDLNEVKRLRWPVAVEFRNVTWLDDEIIAILNRHRAALVLQDMPWCETKVPNDAKLIYIRRHGQTGQYTGDYSDNAIRHDAAQIKSWSNAGREIYIYYNNDLHSAAPRNAKQLETLLSN